MDSLGNRTYFLADRSGVPYENGRGYGREELSKR